MTSVDFGAHDNFHRTSNGNSPDKCVFYFFGLIY